MAIHFDKPLPSKNMLITEFWKVRMCETLTTIYGDDIDYDALNEYLDDILKNQATVPIGKVRDIYRGTNWEINLNEILKIVDKEQLIIGANGSFTVRQHIRMSEMSKYLLNNFRLRDYHKNLAIAAEAIGDTITQSNEDTAQTNKKEKNNSSYGVSVMRGYILSSPDTASFITGQAREFISEEMWVSEKFVDSNLCFADVDEMLACINRIVEDDIDLDRFRAYNVYIPNKEDVLLRLNRYPLYLPEGGYERFDFSIFNTLIETICKSEKAMINVYYKYNFLGFLEKNPHVYTIIDDIMKSSTKFYSPIVGKMKKSASIEFLQPMETLSTLVRDIVIPDILTHSRVDKYINRKRETVVISDTDSIMLNLMDMVNYISDHGSVKFDIDIPEDEDNLFKAVSIVVFLVSDVCNSQAMNMARHCYVPDEYRSRLNVKNEFLFKSIIIYAGIKKNYSGLCRMREGEIINKIANTGANLTSSSSNKMVRKEVNAIILEEIHSKSKINVTNIMRRIYDLDARIRESILVDRDNSMGDRCSYKTIEAKEKPWNESHLRGVMLWNHLYPDNLIDPFNAVYVYNTCLEREEDLWKIKDIKTRMLIKDKIYDNPINQSIKGFGLRTIAVPVEEFKFPEWLVDIMDVNKLVEMHLKPITGLIPSVGVYIQRVNSQRSQVSPIISL